jgi:hypothetical protein
MDYIPDLLLLRSAAGIANVLIRRDFRVYCHFQNGLYQRVIGM